MSRPRTKLQVTTFPFLAVLLCAMGALLLFLFIMDRRGKIAAQNRNREAMEAIAAKQQDTQAERDARQAEWEQAKEKLRRMLLEQERSVQTDAKNVEQGIVDADRLLEIAQSRFLELQPRLGNEAAKIAFVQHQIERERDKIKLADRQEEASKLERTKATLELAELTIAFQELKARRAREKEVYSLVPYRGKQGDQRPPIYVECQRDGVLFHPLVGQAGKSDLPEKTLLDGADFNVASIRSEVERRAGPLLVDRSSSREKSRTPPEEKKGPYVLFLVRPDGIASYYQAQTALRGYQLDFGYELVDEGWVLDFGGSSAPYQGGSRLADQKPVPPRPMLAPPLVVGPPGGVVPLGTPPVPTGLASGGIPGGGGGPVALPFGGPSSGGGNPAPGNGVASPPVGPPSIPTGIPGLASGGIPSPAAVSVGVPSIGSGSPGGVPALPMPVAADPSLSQPAPAAPPRESAFVPLTKYPTMNPVANPLGAPPVGQPALIASSTQQPQPPATGVTSNPGPIGTPLPGNSATGQAPSSPAGQERDPTVSLEPIINKGPVQPNPDGGASKKPATGGTPTLSRVIGNRDFIIIIDCFAEHVTIFPGGMQYRWKSVNTRETDQAVVQTVAKLIERRQASVREGEPPYRPLIRLQVSPEGLRTYYNVYPLLEHLRVPMTRENVED